MLGFSHDLEEDLDGLRTIFMRLIYEHCGLIFLTCFLS